MPSIADVYVTILPETSRVADGIRRALRSVDDDMYRSGRRWGDEIKRGMGDVDVDVDADTSRARREIRRLDRDIDRKRTVKVDHDKSSFQALATATRTIEQNFKAVAIAGLALPNTIANTAQSVVQLSGVLGLLPAVAGTAGLAIGTLKVATMGFGDAMKNIRDVDKFSESVAQMAPNMQQLAQSIRTTLPEIDRLKFTVQDAFGAGLGEQFTKLSGVYLPIFRTAMSQMAASANTALTTVSQMLQQPAMAGDISGMTQNMASAFNLLSQALAPVVKAFVDIGLVGSGFLPQLAASATQAANQFAIFIEKARGTGELQKWIQGGLDAMSTLGRIAGDVWNIFMKFSQFDTVGGGLLGMIEGITSAVSDFVESPAGQGALQTFITTMGETVQTLLPVMGTLVTSLAPVMGELATAFAELIQVIGPDLGPMIQDIGNLLLNMVETAVTAGDTLVPILSEILRTINDIPGGAATVVTAFLAWNTITGIAQVATNLTNLASLLKITLPAAAAEGTAAMGASFTGFAAVLGPIAAMVAGVLAARGPIEDWTNQQAGHKPTYPSGFVGLDLFGGASKPPPLPTPAPGTVNTTYNRTGRKPSVQGPGSPQAMPPPAAAPPGDFYKDWYPSAPLPTPPVSNYVAPPPSSGGGGGGGGGGGKTPSVVSPTGTDWDKVAEGESKGNWAINTGNGYYGGLQFDLPTWKEFGGTDFAERPDLASKEQQIAVAERVPVAQRPNRWPKTYAAGAVGRPPAGSTDAAVSAGYPDTSGYSSGYSSALPALHPGSQGTTPAVGQVEDIAKQFGLTLTSGKRNEPGSFHNTGQAGDFSNASGNSPEMLAFAQYMSQNFGPQIQELIYSDPAFSGLIGGGKNVSGTGYYSSGTLSEHANHVHIALKQPLQGSAASAMSAGYPGTDGYDMSSYSGYKGVREAQEKVQDAADRIADEEAKLSELQMTPGATGADIAAQERKVTKAKREHADALEDLTEAQNKSNKAAKESPDGKGGLGEDFGKDFMGGILEFFGFDGSLFKNPAEFGLVKLLGSFSKLKPRGEGGELTTGGGGGGSGLEGFLTSIIPQPFGPVQPGGPGSAPGQFLPNMPGSDSGGVVGRAFAPAGGPGPGNVVNAPINIVNPVGQDHLRDTFDQANSARYPQLRQPERHLPGP